MKQLLLLLLISQTVTAQLQTKEILSYFPASGNAFVKAVAEKGFTIGPSSSVMVSMVKDSMEVRKTAASVEPEVNYLTKSLTEFQKWRVDLLSLGFKKVDQYFAGGYNFTAYQKGSLLVTVGASAGNSNPYWLSVHGR